MNEAVGKTNWGVERRLEFIEFRLFWEGGVRRANIMETFKVSEPQASKDLSLYQERAPGNAEYDRVSKRYVASKAFKPVFLQKDPSEYLTRLRSLAEDFTDRSDSWLSGPPDVDVALNPAREVDADCLRVVLTAMREKQSVEVFYQSMNKARQDPEWRRITPHALGYDGFRWHVRAYCHPTDLFKDFVLPRIVGARDLGQPGRDGSDDELWNVRFGVKIGPHPDLGPNQHAAVAKDYRMEDGFAVLPVRYAMLFYVLKRLGLLDEPEKKPARSQHIVVINREETAEALRKANFQL